MYSIWISIFFYGVEGWMHVAALAALAASLAAFAIAIASATDLPCFRAIRYSAGRAERFP
jgi:hypothetical protein